jgi:hypothetical protein
VTQQKMHAALFAGSGGAIHGIPGSGVLDMPSTPSVRRFHEDDVLREQLTRNVQFFGLEGQQRVSDAYVIVVGLGVSWVVTPWSRQSVNAALNSAK